MKKLCFVSSSGGHWEELLCLKPVADENDTFYVTEKGGQSDDFKNEKIYLFGRINRKELLFIPRFLVLFCFALGVMFKERPDAVITTGALLSYPFCVIAKVMGKKVIYIESFARVHKASLTGRLVYKLSDLFIVQWEEMTKIYPKAKYVGGIF